MTEAASLNFGPAWLRDSFTSNTNTGEGPPGSGIGGGTNSNQQSSHQNNSSGWDIAASSRTSHGGGKSSNANSQQSGFHMNLHVGGQQSSSGTSSILSAMKLAEHRYGREEMLALYPIQLAQDTSNSSSASLLDEDILEAMETTSLLVPDRRALPPLNLMGAVSEDEQRAWARGANSDTSLRLYSKQKDMSRVIEDGIGGRGRMEGGSAMRGDHRGGLPERGRGRGVGRGGGINAGGSFFDRHRSEDPLLDDPGVGVRGTSGGRGIGSSDIGSDGSRPFGGGRGVRSFDRSISTGGLWYSERSGSNGPPSAGIIAPAGPDDVINNGSMSPRKGYTRAPFDDWRKPPGEREEDGEGGGWRSSGTGPSGRRWNAPAPANSGIGVSQGWRDDGYRSGKYERDFVNGSSSRWREDGPPDSYFSRSRGAFSSSANRGSFSNSSASFSRQRSRQDSDLPEWALDDDADGRAPAGGTFDSSGKFRAPSSESPTPPSLDNEGSSSQKKSPPLSRKSGRQRNMSEDGGEGEDNENRYQNQTAKEGHTMSMSSKECGKEPRTNPRNTVDWDASEDHGSMIGRGRGRGRLRQELRLLHGQMEQEDHQHNQLNKKSRGHEPEEEDDRFEDEEVDVDDLPSDVRKNTLEQRLQEQHQKEHLASEVNQETVIREDTRLSSSACDQNKGQNSVKNTRRERDHMNNEMDDAMGHSLVDSLVNDDSSTKVPISQHHLSPNAASPTTSSPPATSSNMIHQSQESPMPGIMQEQTRNEKAQDTIWFYLDPQGNRQGPFSNADMLDWFNAGYFPADLMLRRSIDKRFVQLVEMSKVYERVPFAPGPWPNIPPPLADLEELEKQEAEKRHREQQHNAAIIQQLQQQAILQQQLQIQQQRLFALQQHQGPDKAALEQALGAQAAATAQALQQQQQLLEKMMHSMSLLHQQPANNNLSQPLQPSSSPSPARGNENGDLRGSDLGNMALKHHDIQAEFANQQQQGILPASTQSEVSPQHHSGGGGLGAFGLGLPSPVLKTHTGEPVLNPNNNPTSPQHSAIGLLGRPSSVLNPSNVTSAASYDPIKSLLNQLQQSDKPSPSTQPAGTSRDAQSPSHNQQIVGGGFGLDDIHRTSISADQPESSPLGDAAATDSPHMGRSIWDMPASAASAPPTPNPALSREQLQHQILHQQQQQQFIQLQQKEVEQTKQNTGAWGRNLMEEQSDQIREQQWSDHQPHVLQQQESSRLAGQEYLVHQEPQQFDNMQHKNDSRDIPADSFSTESPNESNSNAIKNSNSVSKGLAKEKKDKRGKKDKDGKKGEKGNSNINQDTSPSDQTSQHYIPGMEGAVRPEEPVTAAKALEEEQQRAQADALYRLQLEQQQMLERERALAEEKAAKQRQESIQSAAKLAPWAKKTQNTGEPGGLHNSLVGSIPSNHEELSLAQIQRLEEEREREIKMQREMEEQQLREQRLKQDQEEQIRRHQGKGMNWATTAAAGINSGPNGGKSLAEIQAEEEEEERERQERERQQKRARQKEMGLAQASVWGSASANLSWASKAASSGVVAPASIVAPTTPQSNSKQNHQVCATSSLVNTSPSPWSSAVNSNSGGGGFWDDAAPLPGLNTSNSNNSLSNKKKKKNGKETQKNNVKAAKEDAKVAQIFRENSVKNTPRQNDFEAWCSSALANLNAQVDIPTFMAFLKDIESPYEVNDYVKNYIGEGKGPKTFAKEYLERRSQYKNSLKCANQMFEDDLLTPAQAINPNRELEDGWTGIGLSGGPGLGSVGGGAHGALGKSKKKAKGSGKASKFGDASHLLGFSVASGERVNAGDIDMPQ